MKGINFFKRMGVWGLYWRGSHVVYTVAERMGWRWLWFSIPWSFDVLLGLVIGLVYRGVKHLVMIWL
ncbi:MULTISPECIES: hypothetical protein [unclassified Bartonella]|uniref:hypothetical protein n=1 Tax=unclassified Bartonella TaxID=2645622 RepID=UPI0035CF492D